VGKNSIFDDLGFGATDLGLAPDSDKIAADNAKRLADDKAKLESEEATAKQEDADKQEAARLEGGSRSNTILSGQSSLLADDEDESTITRRTLLGS